jgi:hypothetical protein
MSWNPADSTYSGIPYIVKNLLEFKNGCRILVEGNVLENVWGGYSQNGYAIVITPKSQAGPNGTSLCPACTVLDLTIRYNYADHASGGMQIVNAAGDNGGWSSGGGRYSIHDLVFDGLQYPTCYKCGVNLNEFGSFYSSSNPPPASEILHDVTWTHITAITNVLLATSKQESAIYSLAGPPLANASNVPQMTNITVANWIVATGADGTYPTGGGANNCSVIKGTTKPVDEFAACWAGNSSFSGNVLVGYSRAESDWPGGNNFGADWSSVGFVNYNSGDGGDYRLSADSPYKGKATDGTDPGADLDTVTRMVAGVQ